MSQGGKRKMKKYGRTHGMPSSKRKLMVRQTDKNRREYEKRTGNNSRPVEPS